MTAQALPKTEELIDRINFLTLKKRRPSEFDIKLLKREAEKLKGKIEYSDYYDFLGRISALEQNKANVISYYENALKLVSDNYEIRHNYCISLSNNACFNESILQADILFNSFPNDSKILILLISGLWSLCNFRKSLELLNKLDNSIVKNYQWIIQAAAILDKNKLSDNEAQRLCELALNLLETHSLYYSDLEIEIIDNTICYSIYVDLPVEEIFDINWELAGILADNDSSDYDDVLIFQYKPVAILEERLAHERIV
ncbi:MAG: hypothetical protein WAX77_03765 [Methylococcaceae bacterium]